MRRMRRSAAALICASRRSFALSDAAGLLQRAGLALPVSDVETHTVRYESPLALMRELKALGASNPLAERPGNAGDAEAVAAPPPLTSSSPATPTAGCARRSRSSG